MDNIPIRHINNTIKEPDFSGNFDILDVEVLLSGKDMVQELHRHSFFYVLVLGKGIGEHKIDFVPYSISDYSVFFMRPGQVHELTLKKESTGYLLKFSNNFYSPLEKSANQILRKVSSKNFCPLNTDRMEKIFSVLTNILQEHRDKPERYKEVIQSYLDIFFVELLRQSRNPAALSNGSGDHMMECLEELQELISVHVSKHKQVAYYAKKLHLSNYQLNAITKATLGKTCSQVISDYVLLEAKRYLLVTSNQVNQIAWHLGYEDVSYFVRFFKKHTGYSPETFRNDFR